MAAYFPPAHAGGFQKEAARKEFDHSTNQGRLAVRDFVHEHLCLGHMVTTTPL
jgi:hypothetical protein